MIDTVVVRRIGPAVFTTIPPRMAERLRVEQGDQLLAVETSAGVLLTRFDADLMNAMDAYRSIARDRRDTLNALV